jgi:hypothetical protein
LLQATRLQEKSSNTAEANENDAGSSANNGSGHKAGASRDTPSAGWSGSAGTIDGLGKSDEGGVAFGGGLVGIDGEDHSLSTVSSLTAVSPDGSGILDSEVERGGSISSSGNEARVKASLTRVGELELAARVAKGGLGDGVVLGGEDELDDVSGSSLD